MATMTAMRDIPRLGAVFLRELIIILSVGDFGGFNGASDFLRFNYLDIVLRLNLFDDDLLRFGGISGVYHEVALLLTPAFALK